MKDGANAELDDDLNVTAPKQKVLSALRANFAPADGKAYTLNCEFYTQPLQALGYLNKGYLYKDGTWKHYRFNGSKNDPTIYNNLTSVPLYLCYPLLKQQKCSMVM